MDSISLPASGPPAPGEALQVAQDLWWARVDLGAYYLQHVNVYGFRDAEGWTLVDTGFADQHCRSQWDALLAGPFSGRVHRIICTHGHPDHVGQVGYVQQRTGAEFWISRGEWESLQAGASEDRSAYGDWLRQAGLDASQLAAFSRMRNLVPTNATPGLPLDFHDLRQGDAVLLGAADWHVRIDAGHSPAPASFFSADRATMITGDQIMPHVYPFVGQQPGQAPSASPLLRYFDYLKSLDQYEDEVLALPGHGDPFYGIAARAAKIALHHSRRTDRLLEALRTPTSLVDLIPALINRPLEPIFLMIGLIEASAQVEMLLQRELLERWTEPSGVALHRLR